jgi:hypothetical protein
MNEKIKSHLWKTIKITLQLFVVGVIIVFMARVNYLPVVFPDSWKEWIVDKTDVWFDKKGMGRLSASIQNVISLKFLDNNASQNENIVINQRNGYKGFLKGINSYLNRIIGSNEIILSLSKNDEFNRIKAKYFLQTIINNTRDFDAFRIYDVKNKSIIVNSEADENQGDEGTYLKLFEKIDFLKLAQVSSPAVFLRNGNIIVLYAFKGDLTGEEGILAATLSGNYFKRDYKALKGEKYFNYIIAGSKLLYLYKNPLDMGNISGTEQYLKSGKIKNIDDVITYIVPKSGYRITNAAIKVRNVLFGDESFVIQAGVVYPKKVLISIILNILLLSLTLFGFIFIFGMFKNLKEAFAAYRRLKEAPFILLDDTMGKMTKVFDKIVGATKRIKNNSERQKDVAERFLKISPPKAVGYNENKSDEPKSEYGFASETQEDK